MSTIEVEPLGERAWLLRLGSGVDLDCNRRVHALAHHIRELAPGWLEDVVPAYASLAVVVRVDALQSRDAIREWLLGRACDAAVAAQEARAPIEIPVLYGGEAGPDLAASAAALALEEHELVSRHCGPAYQVAMLGFAPGFPYLLGLDSSLSLPRLDRPRTRVAAGSVGIAEAQTGIYPRAGAGGWRLIGRTPLRLFDPRRDRPSLLQAGDAVRFVAIDGIRFAALARAPGGIDAD